MLAQNSGFIAVNLCETSRRDILMHSALYTYTANLGERERGRERDGSRERGREGERYRASIEVCVESE